MRTWRAGTFGPASEEPYRRRPSDYSRLAIAALVVAATCLHEGDLTETEHDVFLFFNRLPNSLQSLFEILYRLGALWAVGLLVAAAFLARRRRLARDLAISGVGAWAAGRLLGVIVGGHETVGNGLKVLIRLDDSPSFPVVRLAVVTAVICAAAPYVTRPVRRVGQGLVLCLALAALYLGTGLPNDVVAAVVLGWGVAAAVHLLFGSPGGRPTRAQVTDALAELGLDVDGVLIAPYTRADGTVMYAHDAVGEVRIRVLGRDEADAQLLSKFWRFLMYKDGGSQVHLTRLEDVQQEAFALLLAERSGARVPDVLVVGSAGPGTAVLATRQPEGTGLVDLLPAELTDEVLRAVWSEVRLLHAARVAHGRLNAGHVLLTPDGPEIVDLVDASYGADDARRRADIAELLVSVAMLVGNERAVASAYASLGADTLAGALSYLQSPALSTETRAFMPHNRKELEHRLGELRTLVASTAGVDEPPLQQLYRVNTTNLLMAVGSLVAVFALLGQIGDPGELWNTITAANGWWLLLALSLSLATNIPSAVALMGTVPRPLPLWRTAELQLSMSFSNLAVPAVGGMAAQVRFLQKQGVDLDVRGRGRIRAVDRREPVDVPSAVRDRGRALAHFDPHGRDPGVEHRVGAPGRARRARARRRGDLVRPEAPDRDRPATAERRRHHPRGDPLAAARHGDVRRQPRERAPLCPRAARLSRGVRCQREPLDTHRLEHLHRHDRFAGARPRWWHCSRIGGDVGRAGGGRGVDRDRGGGRPGEPAGLELPARGAGVAGDERPPQPRLRVALPLGDPR